jgi:hypothetical protein
LHSHGINPGLGSAGPSSFPSKILTSPTQTVRVGNHERFTPSDWSASNIDHYNSADASRQESERIRNEAVRLIKDREDKTVMTQRDADRRIGERLGDEVSKQGNYIILIIAFLDSLEI